jgi:hypothetical protein
MLQKNLLTDSTLQYSGTKIATDRHKILGIVYKATNPFDLHFLLSTILIIFYIAIIVV